MDKKPELLFAKIGLALGGGGARGIAHVGVLRAFEERGTPVACISGTSAGAIAAALYAFGRTSREIEAFFEKISFMKISSILGQGLGLVGNQRLGEFLQKELGKVDIKDAIIPLAIVCTDLISGEKKIFREGPVSKIVQGSASLPGIFSPVEYEGMLLVDGAVTENIPVSAARSLGANFVVAVSLSDVKQHVHHPKGMMDVISRCFDIIVDTVSAKSLRDADYVIAMDLSFINRFKITQKERAIQLAYRNTQRLFSRSLAYWWLKPIIDFILGFAQSSKQFFKNIKIPTLKIPQLGRRKNEDLKDSHPNDPLL